jgi:hypothetical protein
MVSNNDARPLYALWFNLSRLLTANRRVDGTLNPLLGLYIRPHPVSDDQMVKWLDGWRRIS